MQLLTNNPARQVFSRVRMGFTILELVVVMAITGVMVGLILPAVNSAREAARNMQCVSNLHQIGLALHNYHDVNRGLPPGWRLDDSQRTAFGWGASLLPYLDESTLYSQIDFESSLDSPNSTVKMNNTPAIFQCPSDTNERSVNLFFDLGHETGGTSSQTVLITLPSANYIGNFGTSDPDDVPGHTGEGLFFANSFIRFQDVRRGLSNTFMVGERSARKLPATWLGIVMAGEEAEGRVTGNAFLGPNHVRSDEDEFDSRHPGKVNFLWGDGRVKGVSDSIDLETYRKCASRY